MSDLRDCIAEAIYAGGDEAEWLSTVDGSPNSASYDLADRAMSALPRSSEWRVLCEHGMAGPFDTAEEAAASADRGHCSEVRIERRTVAEARVEHAWTVTTPSEAATSDD